MLSRSFKSMLTGQNGDYSSRLTNIQVELLGSRYRIGEGLKADISRSGKETRAKSHQELLKDRIASERNGMRDFQSNDSMGPGRELLAMSTAKARVHGEDFFYKFGERARSMQDLLNSNGGGRRGGRGH